jgi:hypothetical protein
MASFNINFIANTVGIHTAYYRTYEDPINTYPNSESVNVITPGLQNVTINVTGSLYCAYDGIEYTGYVIADCMAALPATNGIPDTALANGTIFTVLMEEQVDPCQNTVIECSNVGISSASLLTKGRFYPDSGGSLAGTPATVSIDPPLAAGGVQATATADHGSGIYNAIAINIGGTVYPEADGTQVNIPLIRLSQIPTDGLLATADVTFTSGVITSVSLNNAGSGYTSTDREDGITIDYTALAVGTAPSTEAVFNLGTVDGYGDEITNFIMVNLGSGYTVIPNITFGAVTEELATTNVVMDSCPSITLSDYDCGTEVNIIGTPDYVLSLSQTLKLCTSVSGLATLPAQFTSSNLGNCHCIDCENVEINMSGTTTGTGKISYQTCWDGSNGSYESFVLVTNALTGGSANVNLGCIIGNTLKIEQGTLDALPAAIFTDCV